MNCYDACTHNRLDRSFLSSQLWKISNEVCQKGATWLVKISSGHLSPPIARRYDCKSFLISRRASLAHSHGNRFWARARHGRRDPAEICCKQTVSVTRRPSINFDCVVFFRWWHLPRSLAKLLFWSYANGFFCSFHQNQPSLEGVPKIRYNMVSTSKLILHNNLFSARFPSSLDVANHPMGCWLERKRSVELWVECRLYAIIEKACWIRRI